MIRLDKITKIYDAKVENKKALDEVSLTIDNDQCKQNRLGAGTAFGLPLHSFHFQKIKKSVFLKVTSCIYY